MAHLSGARPTLYFDKNVCYEIKMMRKLQLNISNHEGHEKINRAEFASGN